MALVPLPCSIFSQSSDFSPSPPQIINSLISLHFFGSSLKVGEALLWPGGCKSSMRACFASVRNVCTNLTQASPPPRQQQGEVEVSRKGARIEKCTSKQHLLRRFKPTPASVTQQSVTLSINVSMTVCNSHWQQWLDISMWCFRKPLSHILYIKEWRVAGWGGARLCKMIWKES